ncbi:peptide chain release factor N(5)-glutamine methyltransferase [Arcanobacterium hippocoleae]|uniref:peptide chain release factor N(5)-glutamine methyltransferase n=1 Tax=Arcanobacterium hippocoleae TaxID=149017 RepID=A0ABU1T3P6_9ACTO|nr:peptide chain release factor N(5)-glutamine methyltransferase [Arcanobacterium hippocoleae]MDR6939974.1 release factor glutamine methyltransferase [Arcanobacterium hippocoleae]
MTNSAKESRNRQSKDENSVRDLNQAIGAAIKRLATAGVASPAVDARELAEFVLGCRLYRAAGEFSAEQSEAYAQLVEKRAARIPLQHLIGKMWFRDLELKCVPGVFIVRPETEMVADSAIAEVRRLQKMGERNPLVLDLCSGSGAIAIAVATETQNSNVHAVEISPLAFAISGENNRQYGSLVSFQQGDALTVDSDFAGKVSIIVTNPPYVPPGHRLSPEVLADPELALYGGGADGLDFPRRLIQRSFQLLRPGGLLLLEHADEQANEICKIAGAAGFSDPRTNLDLAQKPRFLSARKPAAHDDVVQGVKTGSPDFAKKNEKSKFA